MTTGSIVALALLAAAVLVVLGAEWPRLRERFGGEMLVQQKRARRKRRLRVVEGEAEVDDDFAASVERDLANLPVIEEHDGDRK